MKKQIGTRQNLFCRYAFLLIGLLVLSAPTWAQEPAVPTPTPVQLSSICSGGSTDPLSLLVNGDFESDSRTGLVPRGWQGGSNGISGTLVRQETNGIANGFVQLRNNASIAQVPQPDLRTSSTTYQVRLCAYVVDGALWVYVGGTLRGVFPQGSTNTGTVSGELETADFRADLSQFGVQVNEVEIRYVGSGVAYVDNVELLPYLNTRDEGQSTPTPTPLIPTPTPTRTAGPSLTPTPSLQPGRPTNTPTPRLSANSVQLIADPPLLVVTPDDFIGANGPRKQVMLTLQVIGADGRPINISEIDPDATVQFTIDARGDASNVGVISQRSGTTERAISNQEIRLEDLGDVAYMPLKPFDGAVRVIVTIHYEADVEGRRERLEILGVVPILTRTDSSGSLTGATGSFNTSRNAAEGRSAGDRGFRPDQRTNLFFRERLN